jgi:hypothetical protein
MTSGLPGDAGWAAAIDAAPVNNPAARSSTPAERNGQNGREDFDEKNKGI